MKRAACDSGTHSDDDGDDGSDAPPTPAAVAALVALVADTLSVRTLRDVWQTARTHALPALADTAHRFAVAHVLDIVAPRADALCGCDVQRAAIDARLAAAAAAAPIDGALMCAIDAWVARVPGGDGGAAARAHYGARLGDAVAAACARALASVRGDDDSVRAVTRCSPARCARTRSARRNRGGGGDDDELSWCGAAYVTTTLWHSARFALFMQTHMRNTHGDTVDIGAHTTRQRAPSPSRPAAPVDQAAHDDIEDSDEHSSGGAVATGALLSSLRLVPRLAAPSQRRAVRFVLTRAVALAAQTDAIVLGYVPMGAAHGVSIRVCVSTDARGALHAGLCLGAYDTEHVIAPNALCTITDAHGVRITDAVRVPPTAAAASRAALCLYGMCAHCAAHSCDRRLQARRYTTTAATNGTTNATLRGVRSVRARLVDVAMLPDTFELHVVLDAEQRMRVVPAVATVFAARRCPCVAPGPDGDAKPAVWPTRGRRPVLRVRA